MPRIVYVRVKDPQTGHEFDVRDDSILLTREVVKRVKPKQYPPSPIARRPKYHLDLAGQSVTQETTAQQGAAVAPIPEEN